MRLAATFLILALAACTQPAPSAPESQAEAPAPAAITGQFIAISTTAMSITGDLDASADVLSFAKGFRIEGGRIDAALGADTDLSADGGTLSGGSGIAAFDMIELRLVETVRIAADARDPNLCAGRAVSHVILARGDDALSLQIFSGADAPGPNAHDTQLCGIYNFAPA